MSAKSITYYAIEPQRDLFKGAPDGSTCFEYCEEADAEHWAVFAIVPGIPGPDLVADYPTRAAAEAAIAELSA